MVQLELAATAVPQLLVCVKSAALVPVMETATPVSDAVWVFASVGARGELVTPNAWLPKLTLLGVREMTATPVPERLVVCVPALSVTVSVPARALAAVGG